MIRLLKECDVPMLMGIWLSSNKQAHAFIEPTYWLNHYDDVQAALIQATVYVYEENQEIYGFIGLIKDEIAGLFIKDTMRSHGIGKQLLNYVKEKHSQLTLCVYEKNQKALQFYKREQFVVQQKRVDTSTNEIEYLMVWQTKK